MSLLCKLEDSPEYKERLQTPFVPPDLDLNTLRKALPNELWKRDTARGLLYLTRLIIVSLALLAVGIWLERGAVLPEGFSVSPRAHTAIRVAGWSFYMWWQSLAWAGFWSLGHEADHGNVSGIYWVNHTIGWLMHSWVFLPYFSWRITHLRHHKNNGSMEMDEAYVPYTRSDLGLPSEAQSTKEVYRDAIEDSPIYSLWRLFVMQFFGHHTYLIWNTMGSKRFPKGSNHFDPNSGLFEKHHFMDVILSDVGIAAMLGFLGYCVKLSSWGTVIRLYVLPWFITNHWIITMAFLHHTDPTSPHYRQKAWSKTRGALCTIDRPFLGWIGSWFLLGINHNHVTHHLFAQIPGHNLWKASEIIRPMLGPAYVSDTSNLFYALWRSFNECVFVEDEGDVLFYKNMQGELNRQVAEAAAAEQDSKDDSKEEETATDSSSSTSEDESDSITSAFSGTDDSEIVTSALSGSQAHNLVYRHAVSVGGA